jgi:hypothetical protein
LKCILFAIALLTVASSNGVAGMPSAGMHWRGAIIGRELLPVNVFVSNTPPPDWESRRNEAMELLCTKWNDRFAEKDGSPKRYADEDTTDVAIAHMEARAIGLCATIRGGWTTWFNPDGLPLSNEEFVNRWLEQLNQTGLVGTDMSDAASAINKTINRVEEAIIVAAASGGILVPELAPLVGPVTTLEAVAFAASGSSRCDTSHDYDMGLVGLVRIAYLYGPQGKNLLSPAAYNNLLDRLLTQRGGVARWREHPQLCGVTLPIPGRKTTSG